MRGISADEPAGDWLPRNYFREATLEKSAPRYGSWVETTRERRVHVATDDDINCTVPGMLVLEQFGRDFPFRDRHELWFRNLPDGYTFGPERKAIIRFAGYSFGDLGTHLVVIPRDASGSSRELDPRKRTVWYRQGENDRKSNSLGIMIIILPSGERGERSSCPNNAFTTVSHTAFCAILSVSGWTGFPRWPNWRFVTELRW